MSHELIFRPATTEDAPALAARIHEVSAGVTDILLQGLIPGIKAVDVLTMVLRDTSSHFSYKNCVVAEYKGQMAGLLFAYESEKQSIPPLMERMVSHKRIDPVRPLLTLCVPDSLYINTLWVDSELRGQGAADALMDYAAYWAQEMGRICLSLFAWSDNTRAVAFYTRRGFRPVQEVPASGALCRQHEKGNVFVLDLDKADEQ